MVSFERLSSILTLGLSFYGLASVIACIAGMPLFFSSSSDKVEFHGLNGSLSDFLDLLLNHPDTSIPLQ